MNRLLRAAAALTLVTLLAGCSVNAGSAAADRVNEELHGEARLLEAHASGVNDLPFTGSLDVNATLRSELPMPEVLDYAEELLAYNPGSRVSSAITLTYQGVSVPAHSLTRDAEVQELFETLVEDTRVHRANLVATGGVVDRVYLTADSLDSAFDLYSEHAPTYSVDVETTPGNVTLTEGVSKRTLTETEAALTNLPLNADTEMLAGVWLDPDRLDVAISDTEDAPDLLRAAELKRRVARSVPSLDSDRVDVTVGRAVGSDTPVLPSQMIDALDSSAQIAGVWATKHNLWIAADTPADAASIADEFGRHDGPGAQLGPGAAEGRIGLRVGSLTDLTTFTVDAWANDRLGSAVSALDALHSRDGIVSIEYLHDIHAPMLVITIDDETQIDVAELVDGIVALDGAFHSLEVRTETEALLSLSLYKDDPLAPIPGVADTPFREAFDAAWPQM